MRTVLQEPMANASLSTYIRKDNLHYRVFNEFDYWHCQVRSREKNKVGSSHNRIETLISLFLIVGSCI